MESILTGSVIGGLAGFAGGYIGGAVYGAVTTESWGEGFGMCYLIEMTLKSFDYGLGFGIPCAVIGTITGGAYKFFSNK